MAETIIYVGKTISKDVQMQLGQRAYDLLINMYELCPDGVNIDSDYKKLGYPTQKGLKNALGRLTNTLMALRPRSLRGLTFLKESEDLEEKVESEPSEEKDKPFKMPRTLFEQHFFAYFLENGIDFHTPEALEVTKKAYFGHSEYLGLNKKPENILVSARRIAKPQILRTVKDSVAKKIAESGDAKLIEFLLNYAQKELETAQASNIDELLNSASISQLEKLIGMNINGLIITKEILNNGDARKYISEILSLEKRKHLRMADLYDVLTR